MSNTQPNELIEIDGNYYVFNQKANVYEMVTIVDETCSNDNNLPDTSSCSSSATNSASDGRKPNYWDHNQTKFLLQKCVEYRERLNSPRCVNREIFKDISQDMQRQGHQFSWLQCENRLKTLQSKYRSIVDYNLQTGTERKDWEYTEIMGEIFGDKPNVRPRAKCSSLNPVTDNGLNVNVGTPLPPTPSASAQSTVTANTLVQALPAGDFPNKNGKKRTNNNDKEHHTPKRRNTPRSEMLNWLKSYDEKKTEQLEKERLEMAERQHNEMKDILYSLITKQ